MTFQTISTLKRAWDEAMKAVYASGDAISLAATSVIGAGALAHVIASISSRSVLHARSQAFEEIINLMNDFVWDEHALEQATEVGKSLHNQAVQISQAIRQHSQKGRDSE